MKKEHYVYYRPEIDKLSKTKTIIIALTWGGLKFFLLLSTVIPFYTVPRIIAYGADPMKPYSKPRRFLMKWF